MKNYFFYVIFLFAYIGVTNAQLIRVGLNGGTSGSVNELIDPAIAIDLAYFFQPANNFDLGAVAGYSHIFRKEVDFQYIPIGAGMRYRLNRISFGTDIGYAIGISNDNNGGFYYAPRMEIIISDKLAAVASYRGLVIDFANSDIVALGVQLAL